MLASLALTLFGCPPKPPVAPPRGAAVTLEMPRAPLYVGSYTRIPVRIADPTLQLTDLRFAVVEGPAGGSVSESLDENPSAEAAFAMLIAGYQPGTYSIEVAHRVTGSVLARQKFATTTLWANAGDGPSFVQQSLQLISSGRAWGGGPGGRQNVNTIPATGTRRFAIVFVDTNEQAFPSGPAFDVIRANWLDNICNGVTRSGETFSLRRYYQEASHNTFDVSCQPFGPYRLNGTWDEVGAGAGWVAHAQSAITAADADIDYRNFDTVLVVSQTVDATATEPVKMAWPIASIGEWNGWVTADGAGVSLGTIQMPFDWTARDGREVFSTASHELGHNLGMGDQYTPTVAGRNPGAWELMHDGALPELSLAHKLALGWVSEAHVSGFNFATMGSPVDQTITLTPAAAGAPAGSNRVGAEIRIADGLNYYFELRRRNNARIADRALPIDDRVLGTDVASAPYAAPIARPAILLLPKVPPSAGAVLGDGDVYREVDTTAPVFPVPFAATASNFTGSSARLRIQYGVNGKPDPSIRPWGAPPWQTPDIEVHNARNAVDPVWTNVPWQGNPNTVVAKVKNSGAVSAPDVQVNLFVKNYNVGGAPESFLGTETHDIAPGATVDFSASWTPPTDGHYCIVARIPLYQTPPPTSIVELTEFNNVAQSNYDRFISPTGSPAVRQVSSVQVGNPYKERTRVFIDVANTNPVYRTFVGHKWLDLDPGETRAVEVMFEFVGALPPAGARNQDDLQKLLVTPNQVSLRSFIANPADKTGHVIEPLGGVSITVVTGKKTKIVEPRAADGRMFGQVVTSEGLPVGAGSVIATVELATAKPPALVNLTTKVGPDGAFSFQLPRGASSVRSYFVPPPGFGDAESPLLKLP